MLPEPQNPVAPKLTFVEHAAPATRLCLDLGTGKGRERPVGFVGVDLVAHPGVEVVTDLRERWPWDDATVDEALAGYLVHFLPPRDRVHFVNELYRVLKPGGKAVIVTPYWSASRAYADVAACHPPVVDSWYFRLNKAWREQQNYDDPDGYTCDFDGPPTLGYSSGFMAKHPFLLGRSQEFMQTVMMFAKEAIQDLYATLVKRG